MAIRKSEMFPRTDGGRGWLCVQPSHRGTGVDIFLGDSFIGQVPEAEWRRLCRESCGEPVMIRGFTTDDGLHAVQYHDGLLAIGENRKNVPPIKMRPEEWVRLWQCGAAGWQDGPPTEKYVQYAIEYRAHIIPHRKVELRVFAGTLQRIIEDADPVLYAFGEDFPIPNGPGEVTIPKTDIVRHFRVPDPPKAEPVPEPPKFVRMKCVKHHHNFAPGDMGWAFRQFKVWHVVPDGNRENWMYNAIVDDGEWEPVE